MSLSLRHRVVLAMSGALLATPFLLIAAAHADGDENHSVTFYGWPHVDESTVSCSSRPSRSSLNVDAGETVNFVNHLHIAATLRAGDTQSSVDDGDMLPVTFGQGSGSVVIEMLPDCQLDVGTHQSMTVIVHDPAPGASASPSASGGQSAQPSAPAEVRVTAAAVSASPTPKPSDSGKSPPKPRLAPAPSRFDALSGARDTGDDDPLQSPTATKPGAFTVGSPVSADSSGGASGLLTLIAIVSVGGVTAAVIRAILAQRSKGS